MKEYINRYPHCDARILHAPKECRFCDLHPDWQELREMWQIAFTGKETVPLDHTAAWQTEGAVLPCPADYIRGDSHIKWGGNQAHK